MDNEALYHEIGHGDREIIDPAKATDSIADETIDLPKHPGGRPKIKLSDLPGDWREIIIENMRVGGSLCEIEALLDISERTRKRLMKDEPEFCRAIKRGKKLSQAWWLRVGREGLYFYPGTKEAPGVQFNATLWYMNMKNRFGWRDRVDQKHSGEIKTNDITKERAKELLAEISGGANEGS